jgi:hypothetical protein
MVFHTNSAPNKQQTMKPTAQDELGLPLIAVGRETRMDEEKELVPYHQHGGRPRGGRIVHNGFLVAAFTAAEPNLIMVDLLRAGLLSMLLYIQFSIAGVVPHNNHYDNETAAAAVAAAGTTTKLMVMMKLWWSSNTTISWSLVHFCTTSILYRRTIRHASTTTTTTKNNMDHSTGSWQWTTTMPSQDVVWLWLPELIALSTIVLCAIGHVEMAVVVFLVGKYVMAAFAVVYWMSRSIIFILLVLSSSSPCGRSRRPPLHCPNKPEDDEDEAAVADDDETSTTDGHDVPSNNCVQNRV